MENHSSRDPISRMRVYRLAVELVSNSWADAALLESRSITRELAGQLYSAVSSIVANIAEGYGRSSGRDRARMFEYALGSTREAMAWYEAGRPVLGGLVAQERLAVLEQIRRLLLAIIPRERQRRIAPRTANRT